MWHNVLRRNSEFSILDLVGILLAVFVLFLPTVVASQDSNRRIPRYQYLWCSAVHTMVALLFEDDGDEATEAKHNQIAAELLEEGKRDLVEVGRDPAEADAIVREHWNDIVTEVETDPKQFRIMVLLCKDHFPERW